MNTVFASFLLSVCATAAPLLAQRELATVFAAPPAYAFGDAVAGIGDGNGDGHGDFVVHSLLPGTPATARIQLFSGAGYSVLGQIQGANANFGLEYLTGAGDMDQDLHPDFLAGAGNQLSAFAGSDAGLLWDHTFLGTVLRGVCGISDIDNDGRDDVAVMVKTTGGNSQCHLLTLRGSDGGQIGSLGPFNDSSRWVVSVGDVNGDGKQEIVAFVNLAFRVYGTSPMQEIRLVTTSSFDHLAAGNVAGDARKEVLLRNGGTLSAYSATTGQLQRSWTTPASALTVVGDLDADGYDDFAGFDSQTRYGYTADPSVVLLSGTSGALLAHWARTAQFRAQAIAGAGDVDGDGYGDLLLGDTNASPIPGVSGAGGWQLVSGKLLANTFSIPVQCSGGPFPPELGMTRPVLGQSVTFVGRDCPPNAPGTLALSLRLDHPTNLGFSGCDACFALGSWTIVCQPVAAPSWTYSLPLPNAPQLAGLQVAVQAFYVPTNSPIGFDLSNAIWARLGF